MLVAQWLVFSPDVDALQSAERKFVVILTSELWIYVNLFTQFKMFDRYWLSLI